MHVSTVQYAMNYGCIVAADMSNVIVGNAYFF